MKAKQAFTNISNPQWTPDIQNTVFDFARTQGANFWGVKYDRFDWRLFRFRNDKPVWILR
jgi:hypothetical protein